jgi:hypothetical protein
MDNDRHKILKMQNCSSNDDLSQVIIRGAILHFQNFQHVCIYPHIKFRWYRTMLNFCGIVVVILKMATGRNFSMSRHHYLPTYQILMISDNFEFVRYWIQHCSISSQFDMWVDNDVPTLKNFYWSPFSKWQIFQCRDIIIYPHIKLWWYRTMLNFCGIVVAILKMATGRNFWMSGMNSGHHNQCRESITIWYVGR